MAGDEDGQGRSGRERGTGVHSSSNWPIRSRARSISRMTPTGKPPNPDTNKHQYSSSLSFSLSFFVLLLLVTDNFGKFPSVAFKVLHEQTGQFSEPLVPGIRRLTGSKVHTAMASTFTLGVRGEAGRRVGTGCRASRRCSVSPASSTGSASTGSLTSTQTEGMAGCDRYGGYLKGMRNHHSPTELWVNSLQL